MIQIDDAGSGSLIGGTGIGILNTKNGDYYFDIVPLEYYQTELFKEKAYQDSVIKIIITGFKEMNIDRDHPIEICQGYMFDKLRDWLTKEGFTWKNTKIEGLLQEKVEESFNEYVISLGLPNDFVKHARFAFGFHRLLKWVFADLDGRKVHCKTQWKSWQKWFHIHRSIYKTKLTYTDFCLICGNRLRPPLEVITIEYITTKPATINLHTDCYKGDLCEVPPLFLHTLETRIKKSKNNLDSLSFKKDKLKIQNIGSQIMVVNEHKKIIGHLKNNIAEKISFWNSKGFNWKCQLSEISDFDITIVLTLLKTKKLG